MSKKIARTGKQKGVKGPSLSSDHKMSLAGFLQAEQPDMVAVKQVYSDFRTMTASTNQAEYVYRLNSLFDPDFTGVGGQPDGFDQWKALYTNYRVVACLVEVEAAGGNGFGTLTMAPTTTSTSISSAEEVAGLRRAKSMMFTTTETAKLKALWHIGEVFGWPDETVLADSSCTSACTASPGSQAFVHLCAETSGASDIVYFHVKLTYYSRFEVPFVLIDSVAKHRRQLQWQVQANELLKAAAATSATPDGPPAQSPAPPPSGALRAGVVRR
jgi:hypothetical protein